MLWWIGHCHHHILPGYFITQDLDVVFEFTEIDKSEKESFIEGRCFVYYFACFSNFVLHIFSLWVFFRFLFQTSTKICASFVSIGMNPSPQCLLVFKLLLLPKRWTIRNTAYHSHFHCFVNHVSIMNLFLFSSILG